MPTNQQALVDLAPTIKSILDVALAAAGVANPEIGLALGVAGPLLSAGFNAALNYASGTTQTPEQAAAEFQAACQSYGAAVDRWEQAKAATPAKG